jgi:hypothetical protein
MLVRVQDHEVLGAIVLPVAIDVMNDFVAREGSPKNRAHYQPVLPRVSLGVRARMAAADFDADVAIPVDRATSSPVWMALHLHPGEARSGQTKDADEPVNGRVRAMEVRRDLVKRDAVVEQPSKHSAVDLDCFHSDSPLLG